jgi:hypothetical protein
MLPHNLLCACCMGAAQAGLKTQCAEELGSSENSITANAECALPYPHWCTQLETRTN